jgi:UV DNA damage endonuclease
VLDAASVTGTPVIYDNLHNALLPADSRRTDADWMKECAATWGNEDGNQKVHFSIQHPNKRPGAHADFVPVDSFLEFVQQVKSIDPDIMLEVKDKNMSALKCINCTSTRGIAALETEWARYKYRVLEHSPKIYGELRQLLRDKSAYPAIEFYKGTEEALSATAEKGQVVNAAQHVWGYLKYEASDSETRRFMKATESFEHGAGKLETVKNILYRLALKYQKDYLLSSYYFC